MFNVGERHVKKNLRFGTEITFYSNASAISFELSRKHQKRQVRVEIIK